MSIALDVFLYSLSALVVSATLVLLFYTIWEDRDR